MVAPNSGGFVVGELNDEDTGVAALGGVDEVPEPVLSPLVDGVEALEVEGAAGATGVADNGATLG